MGHMGGLQKKKKKSHRISQLRSAYNQSISVAGKTSLWAQETIIKLLYSMSEIWLVCTI